jgi:hypothetical protein
MATSCVEENTGARQAGSRNRVNVMAPLARKAPTSDAVSRTGVPTGPPVDGAARMAGTRRWMTMVNVWHAEPTRFVVQTVVGPNAPAAVGAPVRKPLGASTVPGGNAPSATP